MTLTEAMRAEAVLRLVTVEYTSGRLNDALRILKSSADIFDSNHALQGRFRNTLAGVLTLLGKAENRRDYIEQAMVEHTEASAHFEQAGQTSYRARVENNLGFLLSTVGRFDEAHQRISLARRLFIELKDSGGVAQVDETRAQVLLAEGRIKEAERAINGAVGTLEKGGESGTLAEALTTQGLVWARLGRVEESQGKLRRAAEAGESAGSPEEAGKALLTLMEEHAGWLSGRELSEIYVRADELLGKTPDAEMVRRLRRVARRVLEALAASGEAEKGTASWEGFSFYKEVLAYEARVIERALRDGQGSVTRAARLLGFRHHGSLVALLQARHKGLLPMRTPAAPRRRSVVREVTERPRRGGEAGRAATILFVEDSEVVADSVKSALESLGWLVEICADGAEAWRRLKGRERYDLLIFDDDLPGLTGVELVRRARRLAHRRRTPVVVLSAGDAEKEAWRAGADAFLRKPEDVAWLSATVARLLPGEAGEGERSGTGRETL